MNSPSSDIRSCGCLIYQPCHIYWVCISFMRKMQSRSGAWLGLVWWLGKEILFRAEGKRVAIAKGVWRYECDLVARGHELTQCTVHSTRGHELTVRHVPTFLLLTTASSGLHQTDCIIASSPLSHLELESSSMWQGFPVLILASSPPPPSPPPPSSPPSTHYYY